MTAVFWLLPLIACAMAVSTDDGDGRRVGKAAAKAAVSSEFTYERESAAREFVAEHHPELNALLDRLKVMSPVEYEKAIVELFQVRESLTALRARDRNRYGPALDAWKAKSRVDVLAAQYVLKPSTGLESSLRQAIAVQVDCDLALRKAERDAVAARLRKLDEQVNRLESHRDSSIENRLNALRKKAPRAKAAARSAPASSAIAHPGKPAKSTSAPAQKGKP